MKPESSEALARAWRDATSSLVVDPSFAARVLAHARAREAIERPALVVLAFAASLVLWLSFQAGGVRGPSETNDDDALSFDLTEASL